MNAIMLAAGYATRLYPLTRDQPKSLLHVGGRPVLDYLVEQLDAAPEIERMLLVTNDRFAGHFERWASNVEWSKPLHVINDGTQTNDDRLGAVGDIAVAIEKGGLRNQPAYVMATDNMPKFDLLEIARVSKAKGVNAVFALDVPDRNDLRRMGVADVDADGRVLSFEEKPEEPRGQYRVPPFYAYTAEAVDSVGHFIDEGNNPDAPGHLLAWIVHRYPVHAVRPGVGTWDIGTLDSYRQVYEEFEGKTQ